MREIKFRSWDKKNQKWFSNDVLNCLPSDVFFASEFLQQFTGLTDRNGKEIYEGDLLKYSVNNRIIKVIYLNGGFKCQGGYDLFFYVENDVEIVGNIFQNPELIK